VGGKVAGEVGTVSMVMRARAEVTVATDEGPWWTYVIWDEAFRSASAMVFAIWRQLFWDDILIGCGDSPISGFLLCAHDWESTESIRSVQMPAAPRPHLLATPRDAVMQ